MILLRILTNLPGTLTPRVSAPIQTKIQLITWKSMTKTVGWLTWFNIRHGFWIRRWHKWWFLQVTAVLQRRLCRQDKLTFAFNANNLKSRNPRLWPKRSDSGANHNDWRYRHSPTAYPNYTTIKTANGVIKWYGRGHWRRHPPCHI